jgi:carbamoyltransferase
VPGADVEQRFAYIAASIQLVTEEAMLGIAQRARRLSGSDNVCLAGGVALNVLANARILRSSGFRRVWIQPAAGDAGGCLGAATYLYHAVLRHEGRYRMTDAYLGPAYSNQEIHAFLDHQGIAYLALAENAIALKVARLLAGNDVVGWFQGRMEFGPRALGARSILANPIDPTTSATLNSKIKHREAFRPFAPSTLVEAASTYFDLGAPQGDPESPFMLLTARVRPGKQHLLPAITHLDGTARVQTVARAQNPLYYALIEEFGKLTGVPVLVNTSFNVRGEPIVCTPEQAFNSFAYTDMDYLVMGDALISADAKRKLGRYPGTSSVNADAEVVV